MEEGRRRGKPELQKLGGRLMWQDAFRLQHAPGLRPAAFPHHLHLFGSSSMAEIFPTLVCVGRQCLGDPTCAGTVPGHTVGLESLPHVPLATALRG